MIGHRRRGPDKMFGERQEREGGSEDLGGENAGVRGWTNIRDMWDSCKPSCLLLRHLFLSPPPCGGTTPQDPEIRGGQRISASRGSRDSEAGITRPTGQDGASMLHSWCEWIRSRRRDNVKTAPLHLPLAMRDGSVAYGDSEFRSGRKLELVCGPWWTDDRHAEMLAAAAIRWASAFGEHIGYRYAVAFRVIPLEVARESAC